MTTANPEVEEDWDGPFSQETPTKVTEVLQLCRTLPGPVPQGQHHPHRDPTWLLPADQGGPALNPRPASGRLRQRWGQGDPGYTEAQ